eukprot:12698301-Alexandrium_andersonii.AAC.1
MSASLVGSEMCIRDSHRLLATWSGIRPCGAQPRTREVLRSRVRLAIRRVELLIRRHCCRL